MLNQLKREYINLFGDEEQDNFTIKKKINKQLPTVPKNKSPEKLIIEEIEAVKEYDQKPETDKVLRQQQRTYQLKVFNNWIKSALIQKYVKLYLTQQKIEGGLAILDIGCGKGGDLQKWLAYKNNVMRYFGIDISQISLLQAQDRFNRLKSRVKCQFLEMDIGQNQQIFSQYVQEKFDFVSAQFCLHYLFKNAETANNAFANISDKLLDQGYLLITIPDSNVIVKRLRQQYFDKIIDEQQKFEISNKYYSIEFNSLYFPKNQPYGIKYNFYLEDGVGKKQKINDNETKIVYVPEYLVETINLIQLAAKYELDIVQRQNFINFFHAEKENDLYVHLFDNFKEFFKNSQEMEKQLWDISNLYQVVVFQKNSQNQKIKIDRTFRNIQYLKEPIFTDNLQQ